MSIEEDQISDCRRNQRQKRSRHDCHNLTKHRIPFFYSEYDGRNHRRHAQGEDSQKTQRLTCGWADCNHAKSLYQTPSSDYTARKDILIRFGSTATGRKQARTARRMNCRSAGREHVNAPRCRCGRSVARHSPQSAHTGFPQNPQLPCSRSRRPVNSAVFLGGVWNNDTPVNSAR